MEDNPYKAPVEAGAKETRPAKPTPNPFWTRTAGVLCIVLAVVIGILARKPPLDWTPLGLSSIVVWIGLASFIAIGWGLLSDSRRIKNVGGVLMAICFVLAAALDYLWRLK